MLKYSEYLEYIYQEKEAEKTKESYLAEIGVSENILRQWKQIGLISYDIDSLEQFTDSEIKETMFVKTLLNSGLSFEKILYRLSKLDKPYCYSFRDMFWDYNKNEWVSVKKLVVEQLEDYIKNNFEEVLKNNFEDYLENLEEEGDFYWLHDLLEKVQKHLIIKEKFLWEDVILCRNNKITSHTRLTEQQARRYLREQVNSCPKCGKSFEKLEVFYYESSPQTWSDLCGKAGWIIVCIDCKKQLYFLCEDMS